MIRNVLRNATALLFALALAHSSSALALTWSESGDAGQLPDYAFGNFAQEPTGAGALTAISGQVDFNSDVDMYKIYITGPSFSATVSQPPTIGATPILQLFDAAGFGVLRQQTLETFPNFVNVLPAGSVTTPGVYYLALSQRNDIPASAPSIQFGPIFNPAGLFLHDPDGAGAGAPLNYWLFGNNEGPYPFSYTIQLTGAQTVAFSVPEPQTYAMVLAGLLVVGFVAGRKRQAFAPA
jgi:PEP-CTERM motif-containing protein